MKSKIKIPA